MLPQIFNVRTLCVKFVSAVCAVASGLPVGPEGNSIAFTHCPLNMVFSGPMIHMGAIIGAGVSQFRSKTLGFDLGTDRFKVPCHTSVAPSHLFHRASVMLATAVILSLLVWHQVSVCQTGHHSSSQLP